MRATSLCMFVILALTAAAQGQDSIHWSGDLESAKRIAAGTNRPILIHFWAPGCQPCARLDQEVYSRPEVKRALETAFVPVRLNAEEYRATASIYGVDRWPTDVILAPNGQFVARLQCPPAANQYLAQIEVVARNGSAIAATNAPPGMRDTASAPPHSAMGAFPVQQAPAAGSAAMAAQPFSNGGPGVFSAPSPDRIATYDFRTADSGRDRAVDTRGAAYAGLPAAQNPPQPTAASAGVGVAGVERSQPPVVHQPNPTQFDAQQQSLIQQHFELVAAAEAPPLGLDGFCPVALRKEGNQQGRWIKGDPRFGVVHRGRTYLFSGPAEQQEFLRDPDRYSPVMAGNDPVIACDFGQQVPGQRKIGRYFGDRVYIFASEDTLAKFLAEVEAAQSQSRPNRYVEAIYQAENPGRGMLR